MAVIWCDPDGDPADIKLFQGPARVEFEGPWSPGEDMCYPNFQAVLAAVAQQALDATPIPSWMEEEGEFRLGLYEPYTGDPWTWVGPGSEPGNKGSQGPFSTFHDALTFLLSNWLFFGGIPTGLVFGLDNQVISGSGKTIGWTYGFDDRVGADIRWISGDEDWEVPGPLYQSDFEGSAISSEEMQDWLIAHQALISGGVVFGNGDITATLAYGCGGLSECQCSGTVDVEPGPIEEGDFTAEEPDIPEVDCLTRWAQCWCIKRRDGETFHFTSHDQPIVFRGESYEPCNSLSASAAELGAMMGAPGNAELMGIIADEAISEADLYAGLFDRACIEVWLVPWDPDSSCIPLSPLIRGTTGNLSQGQEGFSMEVLTPGARLQQQPLLETYTPGCRYELGDARCGVDLDALAVNGAATQVAVPDVASRAQHRVFWDEDRTEADGYFDMGLVEWTSGDNAGHVSEVKSFADDQFVLWRPMPNPIQVSDQYEARPGCNKQKDTCINKFDNFANYGGFPDVPGRDSIMQTPNSKG